VETSALSRLFGVIALEGLEFQGSSVVQASSDVGFLDGAVASGFDVVHAAADLVVATDLDFLGRVILLTAGPFVLEGFWSLDPRAADSAFNGFSFLVALGASDEAGLGLVDGAFEDDFVVGETITIVHTFAILDATGGLGRNFLATSAGAVEPEVSIFEGVSDGVLSTIFNATGRHHTSTIVHGLVADEDQIVMGGLLVQWDAFALVDATGGDDLQSIFGLLASVEVVGIFKFLVDLVFLSLEEAGGGFQSRRAVGVQGALKTVGLFVGRAANVDVFQVVSDASCGHYVTVAALEH
jgi:hypothetical protein